MIPPSEGATAQRANFLPQSCPRVALKIPLVPTKVLTPMMTTWTSTELYPCLTPHVGRCSTTDSAARDAASRVATDAGASAGPAPAPAPASPVNTQPGSASSPPGAFSASSEPASYDSGDGFDYEGKADGAMYGIGGKSNASSAYLTPSCCNVALDPASDSTTDSTTASLPTSDIPMGGPPQFMGGSHVFVFRIWGTDACQYASICGPKGC